MPEKHVRIVPEDELVKLLKACAGTGFNERRDLAILRIFITSGARRSEVANLRVSLSGPYDNDVDLNQGVARILGKGARERMIPIDPKTVRAIDRYLPVRGTHMMANLPWLWLGKKGRLTVDGIRQMVERRCGQAEIQRIHVHQLRHSFAHDWLSSGGNESDLVRIGAKLYPFLCETSEQLSLRNLSWAECTSQCTAQTAPDRAKKFLLHQSVHG
jgi:site-specific recombinase XerD